MPELPEVETVARLLAPRLEGRGITGVRVHWTRILGGMRPGTFRSRVEGARITRVWRRAKYLVFDLARRGQRDGWLVGHLRMTGRMHVEAPDWDPGPHVKVSLALTDGQKFHFIDVRKFARLIHTRDLEQVLGSLGPEPLADSFQVDWLERELRSRRRLLKPLLLDQTFLAGIGNIYADESLHRAGLHPLARSERLRRAQVERLHGAIRSTLLAAIAREGSSFDTFYRTPEGLPGGFQDEFLVYDREGEPCSRCRAIIQRIVVGQRGTHYCPRCQRRPRSKR